MQDKRWMKVLGAVILITNGLFSGSLFAADDYSLDDFSLSTASDLVHICTIDQAHDDYHVATAFCYVFLEGAIHYDDAVAGSQWYQDIVCHPPEITRTQALEVFVDYMEANPQHQSGKPVDAIFRALVDKWPCTE